MDLVTLALAKRYIDKKISEEGVVTGATPQQAAQIEQNRTDIADLQAEIEGNYVKSVNGMGPDESGNIEIPAGVDVSDAQAGQIIIVKSVDENGKPTEWEAVDKPVYIANVRVDRGRYSFIDGSHETLLNAYNSGATVGLNVGSYMYYLHHIDGDNNLHFGQIPHRSIESDRSTPNYNLMVAPDNSFTQIRMDIATEEFVRNELENIPEQVNADWDQNDSEAPDYVKNKPFYEEHKILGTFPRGESKVQISITVGKSYIVDCDGVMHTVVGEQLSNGKGLRILNPNGVGVIFLFYEFEQVVFEADQVVLMEPVVYKLDEKFIPDTIARKSDINKKNRELLFDIEATNLNSDNKQYNHTWSSDEREKFQQLIAPDAEIEVEIIYSAYSTEYIATLSNASKVVSGLNMGMGSYDALWSDYNSISCHVNGFTAKSAYAKLTRVRIYKVS